MRKPRQKKGYTFFKHTLLWYMASVVVFLLLCLLVFVYMANIMRTTVIANNTSALRQSGENIDLLKNGIERTASSICYNQDVLKSMILKKGEGNVYSIRETVLSLSQLTYSDYVFASYYLYDINKEIIYMPQSAYGRLEEFYEDFFYIDGYSYGEWHDDLLRELSFGRYMTARDTVLDYSARRRIPYIRSILSDAGTMVGQGIFFIDEDMMLDSLKPILDIGARVVCITDEAGQLIVSTSYDEADLAFLSMSRDKDLVVDGEKCMVAHFQSPESRWTYHAVIPLSVVLDGIRPLIRALGIVLLVMILIGAALAVIFAYRYSSPFRKMLDKMRPVVSDASVLGDPIAFMNRGISNLLVSRENLEKSRERQRELLAETFLFRLMRGSFPDTHSIEQAMEHLEITLEADRFRGVLISLDSSETEMGAAQLDKLDTQRVLLTEVLRSFPRQVLLYNVISAQTIAVLFGEGDGGGDCAEFCSRLYETMQTQFDVPSWYYVGVAVDDLQAVNESFASAEQMFFFRMGDVERFIMVADDQSDEFIRCNYTIEDERKLLSWTATGEMDRIESLLQDIYGRNFVRQHMNAFMIRLLIDSMTNTLIKAVDPKLFDEDKKSRRQLEDKIAEIPKSHSPAVAFELIDSAYAIVCGLAAQKKKNKSRIFIQQILAYIDANYADAGLSLEKVAFEFGITCQYLSSFFKENHGENFSVYLERIRIRQANILLDAHGSSIKDVAQKVGYTNVYTFRRAYSRVMGYNPSQHRRMVREQ